MQATVASVQLFFCKNNRGLAERSNFESKGKLLYLQFPLFVVDQGFFAVSSFIFS
jgi:hypothetical protein